ncbi:MAG: PIN domain-containing protein [bacterium]|nr:PIN domain-containing protein [bacterium]
MAQEKDVPRHFATGRNLVVTTLYLFADTNLFVQCRSLHDLDWTVWEDFDEIHVVVCRAVQRELDSQNRRGNTRVAKRARRAWSLLRGIVLDTADDFTVISDNNPLVKLYLDAASRPSADLESRLDYTQVDDQIIGYFQEYRSQYPSRDVRLLTYDAGPMMTAKSLNLPFEPIPDGWLLPPEPSADEKEIARLQDEVARMRVAEPQFSLRCIDASSKPVTKIELSVCTFEALTDAEISELVRTIAERYPVVSDFERQEPPAGRVPSQRWSMSSLRVPLSPPTKEEILRYQEHDYPEWIRTCGEVLSKLHVALENEKQSELLFSFIAENTGSRPATDALVIVSAEGHLLVAPPPREESQASRDMNAPSLHLPDPPEPPRSRVDLDISKFVQSMHAFARSESLPDYLFPGAYDNSALDSVGAIRSNRRDPNEFYYKGGWVDEPVASFGLECDQWRHGVGSEKFDVEIHLPEARDAVEGVLECEVHAGNLSTPMKLKIDVRITVSRISLWDAAVRLIDELS